VWRITALDREGREVGHFDMAAGELTIGRDTDRQLILPSASVSRKHARVIFNGAQPMILDEGSANGVVVDGVRITQPTPIGAMSRIDVAEFRITVVNLDQPAMQQPMQPAMQQPMQMPMGAAQSIDTIRLVGEGGPYDGRVFDVPAGPATVGRALDNELVFDDPSLSRKHARITREGPGRLAVEDLGSSNGTYVNGRKAGRNSAGAGDAIQFGDLVFRVEGQDIQGTRAVDLPAGRGQWIALFAGGAVTFVILIGMVIALVRKPPVVQAPGKDAIAKYSARADSHLRQGRTLLHERKYGEAKQELDAALDADPANTEARRLSRLAAHGAEDDRNFNYVSAQLRIGDRKALESAARSYEDITEGSAQKQTAQQKIAQQLATFGIDRCGKKQWIDCAWATCKAFELAPKDSPPDARVSHALDDAEKKLKKDKTYQPCKSR
jgi:pSer/pThr/pTyr-binding forkhead associated (FHA) protein